MNFHIKLHERKQDGWHYMSAVEMLLLLHYVSNSSNCANKI